MSDGRNIAVVMHDSRYSRYHIRLQLLQPADSQLHRSNF
jgi:hypothetical protein